MYVFREGLNPDQAQAGRLLSGIFYQKRKCWVSRGARCEGSNAVRQRTEVRRGGAAEIGEGCRESRSGRVSGARVAD